MAASDTDLANAIRALAMDAVEAANAGHPGMPMDIADVATKLAAAGVGADVVSMPCWSRFDAQPQAYRDDILPDDVLLVSIEAGATMGWERHTGRKGLRFGIDRFGASAPIDALYDAFGLTAERIAPQVLSKLN